MTVNAIIPLAAAEHRVSNVNVCLTALLFNRKIFLLSEEFMQVRQRESFFLVVLLVKKTKHKKHKDI